MRPGALLVNVSRGGLVSYDAALGALRSGSLGGFGTDVCWSEPWDPEDELARHPRVLITPHVAGVTDVSYKSMARIVAEEVRRDIAGEEPDHAAVAVQKEGSGLQRAPGAGRAGRVKAPCAQ
jgi:phosphoglycerate dehydrogenase-like enzyme